MIGLLAAKCAQQQGILVVSAEFATAVILAEWEEMLKCTSTSQTMC